MEHLVKIIEALAWPGAVIWLGYVFRGEIRGLLGRVSQIKYKEIEANFEQELAIAEQKAKTAIPEKTSTSSIEEEPVYPPPYDEHYDSLLRISEESPRAALLEAWVEVETSLSEAAERHQLNCTKRTPPRKVVIDLIGTGKYAKSVLPLFESLREMRNEAVHAPQFIPNKSQTKRYLQLAIELALTFKKPLKNIN